MAEIRTVITEGILPYIPVIEPLEIPSNGIYSAPRDGNMSEIQTSAETAIKFNALYPFVWIKNIGDGDCYVSNHPNITAGGVDVAYLPKGEAVLIQTRTDTVYVLGTTTVECHAQRYADSPFLDNYSEGGAEPTLITKSITHNGTYSASSDNADGYSSVEVNVQMQRDLLYDCGNLSTGAPYQQALSLLHNLSDYDFIMVMSGSYTDYQATGDTYICDDAIFDVPFILSTDDKTIRYNGAGSRQLIMAFTNTTVTVTFINDDQQLYRIYGYKW